MNPAPRRRSLRRQLLRMILGVTSAAWLLAAAVTWFDTEREVDALLDAHLAQSAQLLIAQSAHEIDEVDLEDLYELAPYGQKVAFQVRDGRGRLLLRSADAPPGPFSATAEGFSDARVSGLDWRVYGGRDRRGRAWVQVAERHDFRHRISRRVVVNTLVPMFVTLPLLALALGWVVRRALRPLEQLGHEVASRDPHALLPLAATGVPEEAAPLVERLNALFERVARSLERERRFTADAAHELRNPLAALRAQAEVARASRDPLHSAAALDQVIVACDRLARLVDQLLLLARVESTAPIRDLVPLEDLAREIVADLAPAAIGAGHDLGVVVDRAASVRGNRVLLGALLRNLVDNALRHGAATPAEGPPLAGGGPDVEAGRRALTVTIRVGGGDGAATLQVEDDGAGVPDGELAGLGEYFRRPAGTTAAGSGLGLALARRIAEAQGGHLAFAPGPGGRGLRATVSLPSA